MIMRRLRSPKNTRARARGAVLIETVVVLPLLLIMILATAEFGHAFWDYSTLTKSVRDGARFAASQGVLGSTGVVVLTNQLRADVSNIVVYGNVNGTGTPVLDGFAASQVTLEAPGDGDIIVRAVYPYNAVFGIVPTIYSAAVSAPINLSAAVRMRAI